jgi:ribosomal protein S18 acetylase RimI-like enzyme
MGRRGLAESIEATGRSVVHRIVERGSLSGFAITGISFGHAYLQRLAVHPRSQHRGYGLELVGASLRWARVHGARTVLVNTQTENLRALELYRKMGFVTIPSGLVVMSTPS